MKVNLIVLPFEETVKSPPVCLAYIGALLKRHNHEIKLIDLNFEKDIPESDFNVVATTTVDYYNCPLLNIDVIDKCLTEISAKGTPVAILGPHVTTIPQYFEKYGNYLIVGEPELTVEELIDKIAEKKDPKDVQGLIYKKGDKFIKNPPRPLLKELDLLPFPDRSLIKNERYYNPLCKNSPYTMVLSSRGCPYHCTYCYMDVFGHSHRKRSAQNVVDELIEIRHKYNIKEIVFRDDMFTLDKTRVIEICDLIIASKLDITWNCQTRVDALSDEMVKKMSEAGCYMIALGIESGSQVILDRMKKGTTLAKIKEAVAICKKYKIITRGYFIICSPGETLETAYNTLEFAKSLDIDYFMVSVATPYPNTFNFDDALAKGILKEKSWDEALKKAGEIETDFTFEEAVRLKRKMYMKYYIRASYIIPRLTPSRFKILYHSSKPFMKHYIIGKFRGKKIDVEA